MKRNAIRSVVTLLAVMFLGIAHAGTHHYYYTDPQGTVLAKTDAQGNIIATYDYAPYGTAVASMSPAPSGPGYTGHVNDPDTGLVYMQARYYDPAVGRFLSVDPAGVTAGNQFNFNRYDYGNNNPVKNLDPNGKAPMASPLLQLRFWSNYIKNESNNLMVAIGMVAKDQSSRVEVVASGAAVYGTGITASKGFYNSRDSVGIPFAAGEGLEASIDVKYRIATFNFLAHPTNAPTNIVSHASAHAFAGLTGEIVYNPGGTIKFYIGTGVGAGEAAYISSIELNPNHLNGETSVEDEQRQEEWMQEQQVRQEMGFGQDNRDYLGNY